MDDKRSCFTPGPWLAVGSQFGEPDEDWLTGWAVKGPPESTRGHFARRADAELAAAAPAMYAALLRIADHAAELGPAGVEQVALEVLAELELAGSQ